MLFLQTRFRSTKRFVTFILAIVIWTSTGSAEALPDQVVVFDRLESSVSALLNRLPSGTSEWDSLVERINNQVQDLDDGVGSKILSASYIATLLHDADMMDQASAGRGQDTSISILRAVSEDFAAKTASSRASFGFQNGRGGDLNVKVTTVRNGNTINGFLVRANMAGDLNASQPFKVFNNPTSPTEASMPPGLYMFFIRHTDQEPPVREQYESISTSSNKTVNLIIEIP